MLFSCSLDTRHWHFWQSENNPFKRHVAQLASSESWGYLANVGPGEWQKSHHHYGQAPFFFDLPINPPQKGKRISWQVQSVDIKMYQVGWNVLHYTRDSLQNCSNMGVISRVAIVWTSNSIPTVSCLLHRPIASKASLVICAQEISQWSFCCQLWDDNHTEYP